MTCLIMNTLLSTLFLVTMGFLANAQSDITPMVAEALKKGDAIAISTAVLYPDCLKIRINQIIIINNNITNS